GSTVLDKVYTTTPLCAPARISLTAGRYAMNTGCFGNRHNIDPDTPTFLQQLRQAGIRTAQIGKLHHFTHGPGSDVSQNDDIIQKLGFDSHLETCGKQGAGYIHSHCAFTKYLNSLGKREALWKWCGDFGKNNGQAKNYTPWVFDDLPTQDEFITREVEKFISQSDPDQPFYLHAGLVGPHPPFDAPVKCRSYYDKVKPPHDDEYTIEDLKNWRAYCSCITEIDEKVGRIIKALKDKGIYDNTLVIYTSDHGEYASERRRWHKSGMHEPSAHIPLAIRVPGNTKSRRIQALAELLDIGSTVCDFFGIKNHRLDQGKSLWPLLKGETREHRPDIFSEMGSDKMLYDGRYKLMYGDLTRDTRKKWQSPPYNGPGFGRPVNLPPDRISLYDLHNDPHEHNNLAEKKGFNSLLEIMKEKLLKRIITNVQDRPLDSSSVL
ncbi:MAG TPA: sulfatase-like hydrolase/transferase, partial [Spirochaetota bacterium]|nr:sulfatase-like hydrolase/transferase [Spirochaetota bacterium]